MIKSLFVVLLSILLLVDMTNSADEFGQINVVGLEGSDGLIGLEDSSDEPLVDLHDKQRSPQNGQVLLPTEAVTLTLFNRVHVFDPAPTN